MAADIFHRDTFGTGSENKSLILKHINNQNRKKVKKQQCKGELQLSHAKKKYLI